MSGFQIHRLDRNPHLPPGHIVQARHRRAPQPRQIEGYSGADRIPKPWDPARYIKDKTGMRCGILLVVKPSAPRSTDVECETYWLCKCDCGQIVRRRNSVLRAGGIKSCGCMQGRRITP